MRRASSNVSKVVSKNPECWASAQSSRLITDDVDRQERRSGSRDGDLGLSAGTSGPSEAVNRAIACQMDQPCDTSRPCAARR
jgi:hypothetical protein